MFFTKDDLQTIEEYLKSLGKRDTEFRPILPLEMNSGDTLSIVHNKENRQISINDLFASSAATNFLLREMQNIRAQERMLQNKINQLQAAINSVLIYPLRTVSQYGDSLALAISLDFFTTVLHELVDTEEVSTTGKAITTKYRKIKVPAGDNNTYITYIIPTVTLTDIHYPKAWFLGSDSIKTELELLEYLDNPCLESSYTYQKEITTTDYYVILEQGHSITKVVNSAGFNYLLAFEQSTITKDSNTYKVYHFNRAITPTIILTFTLN